MILLDRPLLFYLVLSLLLFGAARALWSQRHDPGFHFGVEEGEGEEVEWRIQPKPRCYARVRSSRSNDAFLSTGGVAAPEAAIFQCVKAPRPVEGFAARVRQCEAGHVVVSEQAPTNFAEATAGAVTDRLAACTGLQPRYPPVRSLDCPEPRARRRDARSIDAGCGTKESHGCRA